jgi:hypothetical protein
LPGLVYLEPVNKPQVYHSSSGLQVDDDAVQRDIDFEEMVVQAGEHYSEGKEVQTSIIESERRPQRNKILTVGYGVEQRGRRGIVWG